MQGRSGAGKLTALRGTTVDGRYRLTRPLARGLSGEVWLARDLELGRDVALKRVAVEGAAGLDRLWAEARALARFSHPHVVTLHHAVRAGGRRGLALWLVMEHVPGGSLEGRGPLPPGVAARIGAQIAGALAALHAEGIVHCDIKPGNVVVTGDGTAKVADFGAAYRVGGAETITPNSAVGYTPDYAAPEVVRGRPEPKSDVFSLGATVYALATGHPPRRGVLPSDATPPADPPNGVPDEPPSSPSGNPPDEQTGSPSSNPPHDPPSSPSGNPSDQPSSRPRDPAGALIAARQAVRGAVFMDADAGPLTGVLAEMLRRDPGDRPDADEARRRLEELADPAAPLPALDAEPAPSRSPAIGFARIPRPHATGRERTGREGIGRERIGRRRHRGTAAVLAVLIAGITVAAWAWWSWTPGPLPSPAARTQDTRQPLHSAGGKVIGDPRTADPCALLDPASLGRFGETELDSDYGNFDRCDVLIEPGGDSVVDVRVDFNLDPPPEQAAATAKTGIVAVVQEPGGSDSCERSLALSGVTDTTITVTAKRDDKGKAPLCAIADVATTDAVEALNRGPMPRRSPALPPESLAGLDACTLLHARDLEIIPGVDAADPDHGFGGWDCDWVSTTSNLGLDLRFDRGPRPDAAGGTATRLNGRPAFVKPEDEGDETCLVLIVHRTYADPHGRTAAETVRLLVHGSRPVPRLCAMATDLARAVSTRLPRT
ncbi:serine/threonine-protein kinase [Nonomuraea fuscirosea]|uniref:serine/threonine-protein kinase n=1 Tax=Nonomuraea fuscirosea TaxID=1291556 RepID=UPI00340CA3F8